MLWLNISKKLFYTNFYNSLGEGRRLSFAFFIAVYKISFWKRDLWFKHFIDLEWIRYYIVKIIIGELNYKFSFIKLQFFSK